MTDRFWWNATQNVFSSNAELGTLYGYGIACPGPHGGWDKLAERFSSGDAIRFPGGSFGFTDNTGAPASQVDGKPFPAIPMMQPIETADVPVVSCPTFSAFQEGQVAATDLPSTATILGNSAAAKNLSIYADSSGSSKVVGPRDWECKAQTGSSGSVVYAFPKGTKMGEDLDAPSLGISGHTIVNESQHADSLACRFFQSAADHYYSDNGVSCTSQLTPFSGVVRHLTDSAVMTSTRSNADGVWSSDKINPLSLITYQVNTETGYTIASSTSCAMPADKQSVCLATLTNAPGLFTPFTGIGASGVINSREESYLPANNPPAEVLTVLRTTFVRAVGSSGTSNVTYFATQPSAIDLSWIHFWWGGAEGFPDVLQGGNGLIHKVDGHWKVMNYGTMYINCGTGIPLEVATEFRLYDPSGSRCPS